MIDSPAKEPVLMLQAASECFLRFDAQFREKGLAQLIDIRADLQIWAPPKALGSILDELVSNAIRASRSGGWIRISAQPERGEVLVAVKDSGEGLDPAVIGSLFLARQGGLSRVSALVSSCGGRAWANSRRGKGSSFYFTIPAKQ